MMVMMMAPVSVVGRARAGTAAHGGRCIVVPALPIRVGRARCGAAADEPPEEEDPDHGADHDAGDGAAVEVGATGVAVV